MARKSLCFPRSAVARLTLSDPVDARLLERGLSVGEALAAFNAAHPQAGGVASFLGKVRPGSDESPVKALELTQYEPLTLPGISRLAEQARARFALDGVLVWHRVGALVPGEGIVLVAAAAPHRRGALEAVDFLMDHLKSATWLWKREQRGDGWHWIEPRGDDHAALARWQ